MSQTSPDATPAAVARRVPANLRAEAAGALVGPEAGDRLTAGRRFVRAAPGFGIDLDLMFATIAPARSPEIGHVALGVLGAGRTAMLFVSAEARVADDRGERVRAVTALCDHLASLGPPGIRIAQALPEPQHGGVIDALLHAGFVHIGELAYLRRDLSRADRDPSSPGAALPDAIEVRPVRSIEPGDDDRAILGAALERSYVDTLDCPELCGLREIDDVIDSHRATGHWRPDLWWLVLEHGRPEGCVLLGHCPDQDTVELVYLGLSPVLRGRGVGRTLLERAIPAAARLGVGSMTCAVDRRNAPAIALYRRLGFREFSARAALVRAFV